MLNKTAKSAPCQAFLYPVQKLSLYFTPFKIKELQTDASRGTVFHPKLPGTHTFTHRLAGNLDLDITHSHTGFSTNTQAS